MSPGEASFRAEDTRPTQHVRLNANASARPSRSRGTLVALVCAVHRYTPPTTATLAVTRRLLPRPAGAWRPRSTGRRRPAELDELAGQTVTAAGIGVRRGAAAVGRRAGPGLPVGRPPAATCPSSRARRPRPPPASTWSSAPRASTAARGSRAPGRSTPRTRRCAGSPTSPGCPTEAGGAFVQGGTVGNLSALVAARRGGPAPPRRRAARALGGLRHRGDALVGQARAARRDGRRRGRGAGRRAGPAAGGGAARDRRRAARGVARRRSSRSSPRPARRTSASSTTSPAIARGRRRARLVAARRRRLRRRRAGRARACGTCSPASSTPTRSSSTRTSGCSRRSTLRAALPRPGAGPRRAHPARRLPRPGDRRRRVEPVRLRHPADPPRARAAVLVLPRGARHRRLPRCASSRRSTWPAPGRS